MFAIAAGVFMLNGCQSSEEWNKGVELLEARGLDPALLPDSAPRDFYQIYRDPESPEHVSEQVAILREAQSGARILVANGFDKEKIRTLSLGELLDASRSRSKGGR